MKKSLIALLVATLPAAAFADVTIYGKIKGGVEYVDNGVTKQTNVDDLGSRIGFKGTEDLGNGLKTIWQVETGFGIDGTGKLNDNGTSNSRSGTFANRESFIGLQGSFGTIRLGNISNFQDSDMGIVDAWEYKNAALGLDRFTRDADRLKNSVRYDLPAIVPGLTAALQYGTKEDKAAASDREIYGLGLGYENSGFFGKYAYTYEAQQPLVLPVIGTVTSTNDKHRLEVGYNANNLLVAFGYNQVDGKLAQNNASEKVKAKDYALTAAYTLGAFTPKFTYGQGEVKALGVTAGKYDQYILGVDYAVSKRTTFGAQYGYINQKDQGTKDEKSFGLNMVHKF
ncbi:porin [Chromobacterium piscinae]|uniref:porin n=1 Tax=Chromobacterium piscinae TaxID=686831 RepID=UPI001E487C86|nr:porin [Chromobacterium piscinae]MCD4505838.1 porin [Chromobacterium piscinae]